MDGLDGRYVGTDGNWGYYANVGFLKHVYVCVYTCLCVHKYIWIRSYTFLYFLCLSTESTKKQRCPGSTHSAHIVISTLPYKRGPGPLRKMTCSNPGREQAQDESGTACQARKQRSIHKRITEHVARTQEKAQMGCQICHNWGSKILRTVINYKSLKN